MSSHPTAPAKLAQILIAVLTLAFATVATAGTGVGSVVHASLNKTCNGVLVQVSDSTQYETACPSVWAYFPIDDPFYNSWLATLTVAKAAQKHVAVTTTGCQAVPPYATVPRVTAMELLD
jgi:hypothetical protein